MAATLPALRRVALQVESSLLRGVDRLAARIGPARHRPAHLLLGEHGEREALFALRHQGFTVVAHRWRSPKARGDLDLVAWEDGTLCIVEVKTRARRNPLDPAESAVDRDKQRVLRRLAGLYRQTLPASHRDTAPLRFDVIAVYLNEGVSGSEPEFDLFRNAFPARPRSG